MSSKQQIDALGAARTNNATLRLMIVLVAAMGVAGMYFAHSMPKSIDLHLAPDMKAGDTVQVINGETAVPDVNVYGFAYYIWQQLNRWQADGAKDYGELAFLNGKRRAIKGPDFCCTRPVPLNNAVEFDVRHVGPSLCCVRNGASNGFCDRD